MYKFYVNNQEIKLSIGDYIILADNNDTTRITLACVADRGFGLTAFWHIEKEPGGYVLTDECFALKMTDGLRIKHQILPYIIAIRTPDSNSIWASPDTRFFVLKAPTCASVCDRQEDTRPVAIFYYRHGLRTHEDAETYCRKLNAMSRQQEGETTNDK